ncbi:hypothetical protein SNE40_021334 [Patella caerulea]|uniref:MYND-type domain-containing protein n=1 Tax=Patella caerulea TaxID=87958 RepID=A0AAN8GGN0_PATCE
MDTLPRLSTAVEFEDKEEEIELNYKTGASFVGKVVDHKKIGCGKFVWPNGARYEGYYVDNLRHGKGTQYWPDGSCYSGEFLNDLRHGQGRIQWSNGESYEGCFYKDRRHGKGTYTWSDGSFYTGTFHIDRKEGYGKFTFANGNVFEGLYKEDEREGPGVMTYTDERQDVGLWQQEKLIKLCFPVEGAFTLREHPEFDFNADQVTYINTDDSSDKKDDKSETSNFELEENLHVEKITQFFNETLDPRSLAINKQDFDQEFFKDAETVTSDNKQPAWNKTPSLIAIQKHVHKHSGYQNLVSFDVNKIINGDRSGFIAKGPLEEAADQFLLAAISGRVDEVEDLLNSGFVHVDVADVSGHTALIGATVGWHIDVINILLNYGADINKLSDEGCSALSAGIIFYYPVESFLYNIAERYLEKPPSDLALDLGKPVSQPKSILSKGKRADNFERRMSHISLLSSGRRSASQKSESEDLCLSDDRDRLILPPIGGAVSNDSGLQPYSSLENYLPAEKGHVTIIDQETKVENKITISPEKHGNNEMKDEDRDSLFGSEEETVFENEMNEDFPEDFESNISVHNYHIEVTPNLVERCATTLSTNERVVSSQRSRDSGGEGKARLLAIQISLRGSMKHTLDLLLRRGADPNASGVPMPVLFFAIKAADTNMVKILLQKGAATNSRLPQQKGGLAPLHIAVAIPGDEGVEITELLLEAMADPDVRAEEDDSFIQKDLEEEWSKDLLSEDSKSILGGRTALQIACARDDNYKHACKVVHLLLEYKANANLLCNGASPLALAIASGNDMAIDELLTYGADPSLPLTHGFGSALCVATSTEYEHRRAIQARIQLVDKLVKSGANILSPILIGPKRLPGTAVDYAYYMFNQDRRIAHMPYHALTHAERETYNARRKLLGHVGDIMRIKATEREKQKMEEELKGGRKSAGPSPGFVYTGAGAPLPPGSRGKGKGGQVKFDNTTATDGRTGISDGVSQVIRKPLLKYCYECGRSVGVRLSACTRCKEVFYCSKACKIKAWNIRHKDECIRIGGKSRSPSPSRKGRLDSPTPATTLDKGRKCTVQELTKDKRSLRIVVSIILIMELASWV